MEYGICLLSVIPLRAEPSHKSEMVTQLLFGELYQVLDKENSWYRIRTSFDNYEGWIDSVQVSNLDEHEYRRLEASETPVTMDLVQLMSHETAKSMVPVLIGSSLPACDESRIRVGQDVFFYEGLVSGSHMQQVRNPEISADAMKQQLTQDAMLYINAPYLWGGRTPFGIDCSGFVQMVYKLQGLYLFRDASQQATQGDVVSLLAEAVQGDLAFFDDPEGNIIHVGMLLDSQRIIHCSGKVKIDPLDHEGIYNVKLQRYTHKLRLIKRIIT
jgi:hypothetical protein